MALLPRSRYLPRLLPEPRPTASSLQQVIKVWESFIVIMDFPARLVVKGAHPPLLEESRSHARVSPEVEVYV